MASIIKIKRSGLTGSPSGLGSGELAYSWKSDSNRLYIGTGTETDGIAANIDVIGGKYFTDLLDHNFGTLTANSAILVDANSKINELLVDNLKLDDSTLSSTNENGDINITPNGTGKTVITNLFIGNDSLTEFIQDITGGSLTAGAGIELTYNDELGTTTVAIPAGGVSNSQLANSSVTIGATSVSLGSTVTAFTGLTELTVDNIKLDATTISAVGTADDISIELEPKGLGTVDVSNARITNVGAPTQASDAATKQYVDAVSEGLNVHAAAAAATTNTLAVLSGGTVTYNNGTSGVGATLTLSVGITALDGYALSTNDRILVKNEVNSAHNGIYVLTSSTVLTRATDYDTATEIDSGDFIFVTNGTLYNSTGWVQLNPVTTIGTDNISWQQFSGAGTYLAGDGLSLNGNEFDVNLVTTGGLEFSGANAIQLKSTVAGNGLTLTEGVIDVVGTENRISVSANAIDISTSYVGQSSITTLGTISTGTWNGTTIGTGYGGTGLTSYATGDLVYASTTNTLAKLAAAVEGKVLQMGGAGVPVWGDLDGGTY